MRTPFSLLPALITLFALVVQAKPVPRQTATFPRMCGGMGWTGPPCPEGFVCIKYDYWTSLCMPETPAAAA